MDTTTIDPSTQRTIETIRDVASNIREASSKMREVVRATSVHEAMIAARDTTIEICETAKELRERGVIKDTVINVEETAIAASEISETAKHTAQQVGESAPLTGEALRKAATRVKSKRKRNNE